MPLEHKVSNWQDSNLIVSCYFLVWSAKRNCVFYNCTVIATVYTGKQVMDETIKDAQPEHGLSFTFSPYGTEGNNSKGYRSVCRTQNEFCNQKFAIDLKPCFCWSHSELYESNLWFVLQFSDTQSNFYIAPKKLSCLVMILEQVRKYRLPRTEINCPRFLKTIVTESRAILDKMGVADYGQIF